MSIQEQRHLLAAHAVVAERKDGLIPIDFSQSFWNLLHRDRDRCRTVQHYPRRGDFPGFAHIQQHRALALCLAVPYQRGDCVDSKLLHVRLPEVRT